MRTILTLAAFGLFTSPPAPQALDRYVCQTKGADIHQLRLYEISRSNRDAFHRRFRDHALPIMRRHGFTMVDMWESDTGDKLEVAYVLAWPDRATMDSRWKAFLADQEWIDIKKKSAAEFGEIVRDVVRSQPLTRLSYSPQCPSEHRPEPAENR